MSNLLPVLTAIKSDWKAVAEPPILGKDVLELLSSSMYVNPLSIYREYIQNATDSIEEAASLGMLRNSSDGKIDLSIDPLSRVVKVRDNGTGIQEDEFVKRLIALGASRKRGHKARGFRGVGRLAGLGYCQELVFRSRSAGDRYVSELRWDCRKLKSILRDAKFSEQLAEVISDVVRVRKTVDKTYPERFFEVELVGVVRHGADRLMNSSLVANYLSQVAPVPFSPKFAFGEKIEAVLAKHLFFCNVGIFLNGSSEPLYRPHRDMFVARKGHQDSFTDLEFIEIPGSEGDLAGVGWVGHHGYCGAISGDTQISGLRLRCGNMQVGEGDLLNELFQEPRFNGWAVGEIHVLDERILPNGRRDHFEQSVHFNDLVGQLGPLAMKLSRLCRVSSIQRNRAKLLESMYQSLDTSLSILEQRSITRARWKDLRESTESKLSEFLRALKRTSPEAVQTWSAPVKRVEKRLNALGRGGQTSRKLVLTARERRFFDALYEVLPSSLSAKAIADRIIAKMR